MSKSGNDLPTVTTAHPDAATTLPASWLARWNLLMQADAASMPQQAGAVAPD